MRDYWCWRFSASHPYVSKENYDELPFTRTFIEKNTSLYNYLGHCLKFGYSLKLGHCLKLKMSKACVSASKCSGYIKKTDNRQDPAYYKIKRWEKATAESAFGTAVSTDCCGSRDTAETTAGTATRTIDETATGTAPTETAAIRDNSTTKGHQDAKHHQTTKYWVANSAVAWKNGEPCESLHKLRGIRPNQHWINSLIKRELTH